MRSFVFWGLGQATEYAVISTQKQIQMVSERLGKRFKIVVYSVGVVS